MPSVKRRWFLTFQAILLLIQKLILGVMPTLDLESIAGNVAISFGMRPSTIYYSNEPREVLRTYSSMRSSLYMMYTRLQDNSFFGSAMTMADTYPFNEANPLGIEALRMSFNNGKFLISESIIRAQSDGSAKFDVEFFDSDTMKQALGNIHEYNPSSRFLTECIDSMGKTKKLCITRSYNADPKEMNEVAFYFAGVFSKGSAKRKAA